MTKNKGGRPSKYPYELLFEKLALYATNNKMGQITNTCLAKATEIPSYVWRDNKRIQEDIKRLNGSPISIDVISNDITELPNIVDLIEANYSNKSKLITYVRGYMDYVDNLYQKASEYDKISLLHEELISKCAQLETENKALKLANLTYKNELKELAIESTSIKTRKEKNISKNVLSLEDNMSKSGATGKEIKVQFPGLFQNK